jgi:peroxin-5
LAAAHLALSISHTNNADRAATLASLSSWVSTIALLPGNGAYGRVLEREKGVGGSSLMGMDARERHEWLVKVLVEFARCQKEELDADVQVALGVLFNTSGVGLVPFFLCLAVSDDGRGADDAFWISFSPF